MKILNNSFSSSSANKNLIKKDFQIIFKFIQSSELGVRLQEAFEVIFKKIEEISMEEK